MPNSMNIQNNIAYLLQRSEKDLAEVLNILYEIDENYIDVGFIQEGEGSTYSSPEFLKRPEDLIPLIKRAELLNNRIKEGAELIRQYIRVVPDYIIDDDEIEALKSTIGGDL